MSARKCNESATSTFLKLSWLQGDEFHFRRERERTVEEGRAAGSREYKTKAGHSDSNSAVRHAAQQLLAFACAQLSSVATAALGVASRSVFRAANERSEAAEKLGKEKLGRLRAAVKKAGKRRRPTQELVAEEAERARGAERHAPEFARRAHEASELKREGSEVEEAAVMARLLVQSYWKEGSKAEMWVEVSAVLKDVAVQLRDTMAGGASEPKTMGEISDATAAWVKRAKAGEVGTVNWEESRACREVRAGAAVQAKSALELLREAVPAME